MTIKNSIRTTFSITTVALASAGLVFVDAESAEADVMLSTDFVGRTVSGVTASNITWMTLGLSDPGDLTAVEGTRTPEIELTTLWDGLNNSDFADSEYAFAPDLNIAQEDDWSVTIPLNLTVPIITLETLDLDRQNFGNSGNFNTNQQSTRWSVSVTGSASGAIDTAVIDTEVSSPTGFSSDTVSFSRPLKLIA